MKAHSSFLWNCLLKQMLSLTTVFAIVLAGAPGTAFAQARSTSPQKAAAVAAPTPEAARAKKAARPVGGQQEGIKVHGDWTIEVRNSDGTLAQRREFKNALDAQGATTLANVLGRQNGVGLWIITLLDLSGRNTPCVGGVSAGSSTVPCIIIENSVGGSGSTDIFPNLTVTVPISGPNAGKLVLSGSATASNPQPSSIGLVFTGFIVCPSTTLGSPCGGGAPVLTGHTFQNPLPIAPGQIIQVTVVISFS